MIHKKMNPRTVSGNIYNYNIITYIQGNIKFQILTTMWSNLFIKVDNKNNICCL